MYSAAPIRMDRTMMILDLRGEKLNSSAACGMESKPTKAQGATAITARIPPSCREPSPSLKKPGCRWAAEALPLNSEATASSRTAPTSPSASPVWNLPAIEMPRMLSTAKSTSATTASSSSPA